MAMTPCESWPARLALTQPTETAAASSSEAPEARSRAMPILVSCSAWTIGMGILRSMARALAARLEGLRFETIAKCVQRNFRDAALQGARLAGPALNLVLSLSKDGPQPPSRASTSSARG